MVAIQVVSDLHLESPKGYDIFDIPHQAPYLALLGDIGYARDEQEYLSFLRTQLRRFRVVFLVLGNHEPWHGAWRTTRNMFRQFEQSIGEQQKQDACLGKFVLLDKTRYDIDEPAGRGTTILGCTLFSRVPADSLEAVSLGVNDFYYIEDWTVEQHTAKFEEELEWLKSEVAKVRNTGRKVVILTHYSPILDQRAVDPRHNNSPIQPGFATELRNEACFASGLIKLWAFGHTHFNCDFVNEQTGARIFVNQRGILRYTFKAR